MADMQENDITEKKKKSYLFVSKTDNNGDCSQNFYCSNTDCSIPIDSTSHFDNSAPVTENNNKMQIKQDLNNFNYSWEQELSSLVVSFSPNILGCQIKDALFLKNEAHIVLSGTTVEKTYCFKFYNEIKKKKSRIQLNKDFIKLLIVKKIPAEWPELEAICVGEKETASNIVSKPMGIDDTIDEYSRNTNRTPKNCQKLDSNFVEKEEEPVYPLDQIKHDFIEREDMFIVCVYAKGLDKDAVKVVFSSSSFLLKFQSRDPKFLQQHKDTSKDTVFTWVVKTRKEIEPNKCSYVVRPIKIEIKIIKKVPGIWSSLEEPIKKVEIKDSSRSDTWMPLIKSDSHNPKKVMEDNFVAGDKLKGNSKVVFDDMGDIEVNEGDQKNRAIPIPGYSNNHDLDDDDDILSNSHFGNNLKIRSHLDWNKPMAKVQPLSSSILEESAMVVAPGYAGLINLGNTCFMNCILQVLANTREFRDYFLDNSYMNEINEDNPLGMKGMLAFTFGHLMKTLWSCKKSCFEPRKLKDLIAKKNHQFFGFAQHDAHEFLAFLLDGLHEDLNRIKKKPYTQTIDSDGRPDEMVAAEAWSQYKQRNDSVVVDLFQGQYKSKLVCPKCGKVSITFDPFLYLSVPLPKKKKILPVTFMWKESYKKPIRFQIQVGEDSTVEKLKEELSLRTKVLPRDMRVFQTLKGRINKFFPPGSSLASVDPKDIILVCEVLSSEVAGDEVREIYVMQRTLSPTDYPKRCAFCHKACLEGSNSLKRCSKCLKVGYCDHKCQKNHWNSHKSQCNNLPDPIGCPFLLSVPASRATYGYLVKHMEGFSRYSVDIFQPPVKSDTKPGTVPSTNLNHSLSQSSSSLNSLDSLSSASSTCTLTGDQLDPLVQLESGEESGDSSLSRGLPADSDSRYSSTDKGYDSGSSKSSDRSIPMSHVMGVQVSEVDRDKAMPTFFIKPVSMDGVGIKGADRFEDRGDLPLEMPKDQVLSMDWRNNEKQNSYVMVQSKELEAEEMDNLNNMTASYLNKPTLNQCLELFTEPEILSPEEAWFCPSCKRHVEASKQMAIWRLPHTLIIQLKRFSFQNFLLRSKIKKYIEFPTRGLDMGPFCQGLKPDEARPIYDLYGVANHHGLLIGGHYTSYVRLAGNSRQGTSEIGWRLCDDSCVSSVHNEKSVVTADAYLLFYRRRGCNAVIGEPPLTSGLPSHRQDMAVPIRSSASTTYLISEDERNGNIIPPPSWSSAQSTGSTYTQGSSVTDKSARDSLSIATEGYNGGEASSQTAHHINKSKAIVEKSDLEKDNFCCDSDKDDINDLDFLDADDEGDRGIMAEAESDLGYTDMEAVD